MRIGTMRIDPLLDGEIADPPAAYYTNVTHEDWAPYRHLVDQCTGSLVETVGGLLVRDGERVVVIDTGGGPHPTFPFVGGAFRSALAAAGVAPAEVTDVVFSHLHLDHIGWASIGGRAFFPNATYRVDRRDWDHFTSVDYPMPEWEIATSDPTRDSAVAKLVPIADRFEFFQGDAEVLPGIRAVEASGHTPGSTVLELESGGERAAMIGDVVHALPELVSEKGWEFFAHTDGEKALDSVRRISKWLTDEKLPFVGAHVTGLRWNRIELDHGRRVFVELS